MEYRKRTAAARLTWQSEYQYKNAGRISERKRKYDRFRATGFTADEYNAAFALQSGCCALCGRHAAEIGALHADHCHTTGIKRKLLCRGCNTALGSFRDDPELLRRAAAYIESYATDGGLSEIRTN